MKKVFKERFEKKIPKKNYYIVIIGSLLTIGLVFLVRSVYLNFKEKAISSSVFDSDTITQINTEDLSYAFGEINNGFLYVGYTGDYDVYLSEKNLYNEFKRKNLLDKVIYWNVNDTKDYISLLKETFKEVDEEITTAPLLIYFKDGEALEAMSSELKIIDGNVLKKLVEKYEIK